MIRVLSKHKGKSSESFSWEVDAGSTGKQLPALVALARLNAKQRENPLFCCMP